MHFKVVVHFECVVSRVGTVVERLRGEHPGFLQRDGYAADAKASVLEGVIILGCFAHAPRKRLEVMKALPTGAQRQATATLEGMKFVTDRHEFERQINVTTMAARRVRDKPSPDRSRSWRDAQHTPPKGLSGQATDHTSNRWPFHETRRLDDAFASTTRKARMRSAQSSSAAMGMLLGITIGLSLTLRVDRRSRGLAWKRTGA